MRKFRGKTEKLRKNKEKEIKFLKNCPIKLENLKKSYFIWKFK